MNRTAWVAPGVLLLAVILLLGREPRPVPPIDPSATADRIVSLAPSLTDIVLALGAGDRLVGVTTSCEGVPDAIARVGGLRPDLEAILRLRPDRVLAIETETQAGLRTALAARGIAVGVHPAESVDDLRGTIRSLGALLGREEVAEIEIARLDRALADPPTPTIRGMFVVQRQPTILVAGGGSFVDAMLRASGIENVFGDSDWNYRTVSFEAVVERDPVIILDASFGSNDATSYWTRFQRLSAVREGGVVSFPPVRPDLGIPEWVEMLRREADARRP